MKGLILAGGFATRLRPLSCSKPKLLFPIVGVPLIDLMIDWLKTAGVDEVVLAVNHLADQLQAQIGENRKGSRIIYSIEKEPLGTGGPIRLARKILETNDDFIVLNGDIVSNIDLAKMIKAHRKSHAEATIALIKAYDPSPYGLVHLNKESMIEKFDEKTQNLKGPGLVNAGVYILKPRVVDRIPENGMVSIERQVFPGLAKENLMQGWQHTNGYWYDIGKIPDYVKVNRELLNRKPHNRSDSTSKFQGPNHIGRHTKMDETAMIGPYTILSDNVTVKSGAIIRDSIIFEDTIIGENCHVEGTIVGENVKLGPNVRLGKGTLVAGQISIPPGQTYPPNSQVLNA